MTINAPGLNPLEVEGLPPVGDALNPATPFRRLMGSMATSYAGAFIVSAVPVGLLLTVHLSAIAGAEAASAFSIVTGCRRAARSRSPSPSRVGSAIARGRAWASGGAGSSWAASSRRWCS